MCARLPEKPFIFAPASYLHWEIISISARRLENETVNGGFSRQVLVPHVALAGECDDILAAFEILPSFARDVCGFSDT